MIKTSVAKLGRLAPPIGALAVAFSASSLWFLFALKDFSSAIRDAYETPPGVVQYVFFGIVCLSLLLIFLGGVGMLVLGLTRHSRGRLTNHSSGTR